MTSTEATELRTTARAQWKTISRFYSSDGDALGLIADFITHENSPATPFKAAMIRAALQH